VTFEASCTSARLRVHHISPTCDYHCLSSSFSLYQIARPISLFSRFVSYRSLNAPSTSPPFHRQRCFHFYRWRAKPSVERPDL